jgi:membrane associated rhomboid family serine protease
MTVPEEPASPRSSNRLRQSPVTVALIGLCLGVFVATLGACVSASPSWGRVLLESLGSLGACRETLVAGGGLELARVWVDGEWWRVATTGLQHGSWLHVILNTWSLWVVGEFAEAAWGRARLLVLFVLSSTVGCLASVGWAEAAMVVGASAGVLGIAGALLVGRLFGRGHVAERLSPISARHLGWTLALLLGIGFVVPIIAQAGHIGGLLVGGLLGLAWADPNRRLRVWLARAGLLGLTVGLTWAARAPAWRPGYHEYVGYRLLDLDRHDEAADAFDRALAMRPSDPVLANAVAYGLAEAGVDLERAEQLVAIALEADPENADYLDTLGWIHCRTGRVESGLVLLQRASEASGGGVEEIEKHIQTCAEADVPRGTSRLP